MGQCSLLVSAKKSFTPNAYQEKESPHRSLDWSQHFWILPISETPFPESDLLKLGGYCLNSTGHPSPYSMGCFLSSRWGIRDMWRETTSSGPINGGEDWFKDEFWPIGRPYDAQFAQQLVDRAALGIREDMKSDNNA